MNLKQNKGFTQIDIIIAVIIIVIFVSMIAALFTNLANEYKQISRKSDATSIAINVIEKIKQIDYSKIDEDADGIMTVEEINNLLSEEEKIDEEVGYLIEVEVLNYKDYEENVEQDIEDILKKITVKVNYTVGKTNENVTIETLITSSETV